MAHKNKLDGGTSWFNYSQPHTDLVCKLHTVTDDGMKVNHTISNKTFSSEIIVH